MESVSSSDNLGVKFFKCGFCSFTSKIKAWIKKHTIKLHSIFPCNKCSFSADNMLHLQDHETSQHDKTLFRSCSTCDFVENGNVSLRRHVKETHGFKERLKKTEDVFQCNQCDFKTKFSTSLSRHEDGFHKGKLYTCDKCEYTAKQKDSVKFHSATQHGSKTFACSEVECGFKSGYKSAVNQHIKQKHEGLSIKGKIYNCDECNLNFKSKIGLKQHTEAKHDGIVYRCDSCEYKTQYKQFFKTHQCGIQRKRIEKTNKEYECNVCVFSTQNKKSLSIHKKGKHGNQIFNVRNVITTHVIQVSKSTY